MSEESLTALSATKAAAEIARGAISSEDYTRACLDRIAALEPRDPEDAKRLRLDPMVALRYE